jgi:hypothetical protein
MNSRLDKLAASLIGSRDPEEWALLVSEIARLGVIGDHGETVYRISSGLGKLWWDLVRGEWVPIVQWVPFMTAKRVLSEKDRMEKEKKDGGFISIVAYKAQPHVKISSMPFYDFKKTIGEKKDETSS